MTEKYFKSDAEFLEFLTAEAPDAFATTVRLAGNGIWHWDIDTDELTMSNGLYELYGIQTNVRPTTIEFVSNYVHPEDVDRHKKIRSHIDKNDAFTTYSRIRHAKGHYVHSVHSGLVQRDADGNPISVIGLSRDQTELEITTQSLARAEELAGLGSFDVELKTAKIYWSPGVFRIHGYEPDSFEPDVNIARSHYHDDDKDRVIQVINSALLTGGRFEYRTRLFSKDKSMRHVKVIGNVEIGTEGEPIGYYGAVQDITDEVLLAEQIHQAQKMEAIGNMTGGVAHDFNNILAIILGNLEHVQDNLSDPDASKFIDASISAVLRGADLTRNMLSFARKAELTPTVLDINDVIRRLGSWTSRILPENIHPVFSLDEELWKTELDVSSLESAILNLILNARDAMPDGGQIKIETSNRLVDEQIVCNGQDNIAPGKYVVVTISDDGEGIPEHLLSTVFEPFYTSKQPGSGTGLGLSMVVGFMRQSGGGVRAYSDSGAGTTIQLFFSTQADLESTKVADSIIHPETQPSSGRILFAEDDARVAEVMVAILEGAGYEVQHEETGDAAKAVFESDSDFDLLVTDVVMRGSLLGTALARELREHKPGLPVIYMSGYAMEATVHEDDPRIEDIRLMKPVRKSELIAAIEKSLAKHRLQ